MTLKEKLERTGLTKAEASVYLAALELGETLPKRLAEEAGIKRPTLYEILPKLIEKGLLAEVVHGKRRYLLAQDVQPYLEKKQQELSDIQDALPELRALLANASSRPQIIVHEGVEGIKRVYADHLLQREPVLELVGIEQIHPELRSYIANYYIPERARRKIPLKMLVNGPTVADSFNVKSNSLELRDVRVMRKGVLETPLGLDIYGDNVSVTLHRRGSEMIGLVIRSKEIAHTLRSIFEFLWSAAEPDKR